MIKQRVGFWFGIIAFASLLLIAQQSSDSPQAIRMAAIATLMAIWWITEAIPLAATSLLPLALYPLLGIMSGKQTAPIYINHVIFLFLGGFMIALAMEKWDLHKRIALVIIRRLGNTPSQLLLGFMLATAFLSMWISNTATTLMMLAIALAIIKEKESLFGKDKVHSLSVALLLGIAYASSIGGMATLVGTPPNLSFVRIYELMVPMAPAISFGQWLLMGFPIAMVMFILCWWILKTLLLRCPDEVKLTPEIIDKETKVLGAIKREEIIILIVFITTALLWIFRVDLQLGSWQLPGWSRWLPFSDHIDDGTVAITMALLLFFIPAKHPDHTTDTILNINVFMKIPWHIILLFGGGFALAQGLQESGLAQSIAQSISNLDYLPLWSIILIICSAITFMTELTSNTATTEMVLPILAASASGLNIAPLLLMIPATLCASCAFMLPVATPPNAIVFASGRIKIAEMVKVGLVLNLTAIIIVASLTYLLIPAIF